MLFDHADIYCDGVAENIFGKILKDLPEMRRKVLIATKCGIRKQGDSGPAAPFRYDFSAEYIIESCERSLKRLGVEVIDLYQLHRPDYLCDPTEVAEAFTKLREAGKVREFGVSNFRPSQVTLLQRSCPMRLIVNQVEISLLKRDAFEDGTLEQCMTDGMTPMAWSPLGGGQLGGGARQLLPWQETYRPKLVVSVLDEIANERKTSRTAIAIAWLLKHPAGIVPIVGSTNPKSISEASRAVDIELSREEWYRLFEAARGERLP
jgi:predicted oxidoreductase